MGSPMQVNGKFGILRVAGSREQIRRGAMENKLDEMLCLHNIWRCNCTDEKKHIDPEFHDFLCFYAIWHEEKAKESEDED
jgi:hypothetical protein